VVAESQVEVQVAGVVGAVSNDGPVLVAGAATAAGPWRGLRATQSIELQGRLSDGISVAARGSTLPRDGTAAYAFSRSSLPAMPLSLQLSASDWRVDAGMLSSSISPLTGVNIVGRGASAAVKRGLWSATALAAAPDPMAGSSSGSLAGTRVEVTPTAGLMVSSAITRLRQARAGITRSLDAVSVGGGLDRFGGQLGGELAYRRFDQRSAAGWAAYWQKRSPDENIDIRYVHAPGGSEAFARAASELIGNGSRRIAPDLSVNGSVWRTSDNGSASLSGLRMDGASLGAQYAVTDGAHLSVSARHSRLDARTGLGTFGSGERGVDAAFDIRHDGYAAQVTVSAAHLMRHTAPDDGSGIEHRQAAPRATVRSTVGRTINGIMFGLAGAFERTGGGIGAAPRQWSYGGHASGSFDVGPGDGLQVDAALERFGGAFANAQPFTARIGAELSLPAGTAVIASVERNPHLVPGAGPGAWMYVVGVTRAVPLPRLTSHGTRGRVFRDLNGNGRADTGEPGFPGVVLRRGTITAVSDSRGVFSLGGDERQPYQVDARSFPLGWLAASTTVPGATREIAAIAVSPLTVHTGLDGGDTSRVPRSELARLRIAARDESGHEWLSRRTSDTTVVFDALPPGRYSVVIDASEASEPLRPVTDPGVVVISSGRATATVRIVMRARALRFSNPRRGGDE
jgi:hypothetical protein